jgi:hypothetical protein
VSNAIRYDPLLVRYLAEELDRLLRGRACASAPFFAARRVALLPLDRGEALEMDLHPQRGWFRIVPWQSDGYEADAVCTFVAAPPDERRLTIGIDAPDSFRAAARRLEVELHTNQWNVLLVSQQDDRVHAALWSRRAGERALAPGAAYRPPPTSPRLLPGRTQREEALGIWRQRLGGLAPAERAAALVQGFAWTGTVNAGSILGAAGDGGGAEAAPEAELERAFERWWALCALPPARPAVLRRDRVAQPYPLPLDGWGVEAVPTLLEAMTRVSVGVQGSDESHAGDALLAAARLRLEGVVRRVRRLEAEQARESEADQLRLRAKLLLAKLHEVPKGAAEVVLKGWEGEAVRLELDPTASAAENAADWYAEARKRERAAARLPVLVAEARREVERWEDAVRRGERGELPAWVARELSRGGADGGPAAAEGSALPYRVFRSSGGLEIRVGRSSRANDQLTFGHSSPNDVWLHARSVPGSHVILRWRDPEGAPPARDLEEAARLAAYYSKARSSAIVPVDWTRRKYVRKPRGAAPGSVIPQRVRTLFVEPASGAES